MNVHRLFTTSSDIVFFHVQLAWHRKYHIWAAISVSKILPILPRSKPSQVSQKPKSLPSIPLRNLEPYKLNHQTLTLKTTRSQTKTSRIEAATTIHFKSLRKLCWNLWKNSSRKAPSLFSPLCRHWHWQILAPRITFHSLNGISMNFFWQQLCCCDLSSRLLFFEQSKHLHIQRLIQYPGVPGRHLAMAIWALLSTAATVGFFLPISRDPGNQLSRNQCWKNSPEQRATRNLQNLHDHMYGPKTTFSAKTLVDRTQDLAVKSIALRFACLQNSKTFRCSFIHCLVYASNETVLPWWYVSNLFH